MQVGKSLLQMKKTIMTKVQSVMRKKGYFPPIAKN